MEMDVANLLAIDVHVHAEVSERVADAHGWGEEAREASTAYFKNEGKQPTLPEIAAYYRERRLACVIFPVDMESTTGITRVPNEEVAEAAAANPDVFIPFASIDPAKGKMGAREARRLIEHFGVRGFKFHPSVQAFYPNDRSAYVLYEAIAEAGLPAIPALAPACAAGAAFASNIPTRCTWMMSRSISPICRSSWRTHPSPGRTRPFPSACTSRRSTLTSPAGRPNTFRRSLSSTPIPCSNTKCSSAATTPCSPPTAGSPTSSKSLSS